MGLTWSQVASSMRACMPQDYACLWRCPAVALSSRILISHFATSSFSGCTTHCKPCVKWPALRVLADMCLPWPSRITKLAWISRTCWLRWAAGRPSPAAAGRGPGLGARCWRILFRQAGISLIETGSLQEGEERPHAPEDRELEWAVLEADLVGTVPAQEIQRMKLLDEQAWERGERVLFVPTYFAWGRVMPMV